MMRSVLATSVLLCTSAGCSTADNDAETEDALVTLPLSVTESGEAFEATFPATESETPFACLDQFDRSGTRSIACSREKESLEILHRGNNAVAIYHPKGKSSTPTFYECISKKRSDLPTAMACSAKKPISRAHGGGLASGFASDVEGITIPNTHALKANLFRGMAPTTEADYDELVAKKVASVLIFKVSTDNEVEEEIATLEEKGIEVLHVPFAWKDLPTFQKSCEQTVTALQFLRTHVATRSKATFFHCSVGEDRTGYLSGLYRLLENKTDRKNREKVFREELCDRGFSTGNPVKPAAFVTSKIDRELLPLYRKMEFLISEGKLDDLDQTACIDPKADPAFTPSPEVCTTSANFRLD